MYVKHSKTIMTIATNVTLAWRLHAVRETRNEFPQQYATTRTEFHYKGNAQHCNYVFVLYDNGDTDNVLFVKLI